MSYEALQTLTNDDATPEEQAVAMQKMINDGSIWRMEGAMGRAAMAALERGDVMLGTTMTTDYYGNRIPARTMVEDGSKGSRALVVEQHDEEWAAMLEAAENTNGSN